MYEKTLKILVEKMAGRSVSVISTFPNYKLLGSGLWFLGSFSWTSKQQSYVIDYAARHLDDIIVTPTQIARAYLDVKFPRRLRTSTEQYQKLNLASETARPSPYFATPTGYGHFVYVDLKSAYWQIMNAGGWDVDYNPDKFVGFGKDVLDFPFPDDKLARNMLVSAGLRGTVQTWDGKNLRMKKVSNKHANGVLWQFTQDILHGVALDMKNIGAVYVAVDGYIIPQSSMSLAAEVLDSWGLNWGIKYSGLGRVVGATNYEFENKPLRKSYSPNHMDNLGTIANLSWLRKKFRFAVDTRQRFKR